MNNEDKKEKRVKITNIILSIIAIILLILILLMQCCDGCGQKVKDIAIDWEIENGDDWDGKYPTGGKVSEANSETISLLGYGTMYVSKDKPNIQLINKAENTVYLQYVITEGDTVLFETGLIEPNKMIDKDFYSVLSKGTHICTFTINTYDIDTKSPCNGAKQDVTIVVE